MVKSRLVRVLIGLAWLGTLFAVQPGQSLHAAAPAGARAAGRFAPPPPAQPAIAGDELWDRRFALGANNNVFAEVFAPNGDLYVAGAFTYMAGLPANYVARWSAAANQWSALGSGVNGYAWALALSGNVLYVGGYFSHAGGVPANTVAAWNINTQSWSNLGTGMAHATFPAVFALAVDGGGHVYAGGRFDTAGGVAAQNVARWNGSAWSAVGVGLGTTNEEVFALALSGADVYAGGTFNLPFGELARFDGANWNSVGGGVHGAVQSLAISGSSLYVGGLFTETNTALTVNYVAQWDISGASWSALGTGLAFRAYAVAVGPGGLYVTGNFDHAGGVPAQNVAWWNGSAWAPLKNPLSLVDGLSAISFALAVRGNDVMVGGQFDTAGGRPARFIARWNAVDQQWYSPGNTVNGRVDAVAVSGSNVFIGGDFTSAGGLSANGVAQWNSITNDWTTLGFGLSGCTSFLCSGPTVMALAVDSNFVYAGGNFTTAGGLSANNVARWDRAAHTWNNLGLGVIGCTGIFCNASVNALALDGGSVDAGGQFITITAGAVTANNLARWSGSAWQPLVDSGHTITGTNGPVYALASDGLGHVYIGGAFTIPFPYFVLFNGDWVSGQTAPNGPVRALALSANFGVFIGGDFTNAAGSGANYVALSVGHNDWQPLGASPNNSVVSLSLRGNTLFAGGVFTQTGILGASHIAAWDAAGNQWSDLGSGTNALVSALAVDGNFVYAGGGFNSAGAKESDNLGRWGGYDLFLPTVRR